MKFLIWIVLLMLPLSILSQSIDEEEPVHFQVEGSANAPSDDEDIAQEEASGLPPENTYASSPALHPKMTTVQQHHIESSRGVTEEITRPTTTIVKQYKVSTYATTTPRISTRPSGDSASSGSIFGNYSVLIGLLVIVVIILAIIVVIICCCNKRKYEPAKRDDYQ